MDGQPDPAYPAVRAGDLLTVLAGVTLGVVLLAGLLYVGGSAPLGAGDQSPTNSTDNAALNTTAAERAVVDAINRERVARGLEPVESRSRLAAVARNHSRDMIERAYYAHESPDGKTAFDRIEAGHPSCDAVGENIAATWWQKPFQTDNGERDRHTTIDELAEGLTAQWLDSESHRENLLDSRWERTGVGVAVAEDGEVIVTQNFCG